MKTFKGFIHSIREINRVQAELQGTTTILQTIKNIAFYWGKSSSKKLFDGLKAVYNTIAYVGAEIGKYRYSILRYLYEKFLNFLFSIDRIFTKPGRAWVLQKIHYEQWANTPRGRFLIPILVNS